MLTDSTLFFVNLTSNFRNNPKFNLTGRVNGWITNITDPINPEDVIPNAPVTQKPCATRTSSSSAKIPPSTLFSQSQATLTSSATSLAVLSESYVDPKVSSLSNAAKLSVPGGKEHQAAVESLSDDEWEVSEESVVLTQMVCYTHLSLLPGVLRMSILT